MRPPSGRCPVRISPELQTRETQHAPAEQPGVLAILSRWRSSVRIRSGVLVKGGRMRAEG